MNIFIAFFLSISFTFSNYNQFNQAFIDVSKQQSPSIVSIVSEKTEKIKDMFFFNPFFEDFGDQFQQERKSQSLGSGVIINADKGYIVTNNHVIGNADEIEVTKFGDNDNLSAMVANLVDADLLALLTDTNGLYTADPTLDANAQLIPEVREIDSTIEKVAQDTFSSRSKGGMTTKIQAARLATASGTPVFIAKGTEPNILITS